MSLSLGVVVVAQLLSRVPHDPMDCSAPGFPVHHHLLELVQTYVHWVSDAIQPSHPVSSPSPSFFLMSTCLLIWTKVCLQCYSNPVLFRGSVVLSLTLCEWPYSLIKKQFLYCLYVLEPISLCSTSSAIRRKVAEVPGGVNLLMPSPALHLKSQLLVNMVPGHGQ